LWKYEVDMLKIIIIIIGYILNNFTTHITNIIVGNGKLYNFKILKKRIHFLKKKWIVFVNVENDPRLTVFIVIAIERTSENTLGTWWEHDGNIKIHYWVPTNVMRFKSDVITVLSMDEKSHNQSCRWRKKDVALFSMDKKPHNLMSIWMKWMEEKTCNLLLNGWKFISHVYLDEVQKTCNLLLHGWKFITHVYLDEVQKNM
jgi:hypothetical protein